MHSWITDEFRSLRPLMSVRFGVEELTAYHVYLTVVRFLEGGGVSTLKLLQYYHLNVVILNS